MNLILFGFKMCGKTTLGKRMAEELGLPFLDTDLLIETLYAKEYDRDLQCREIALQCGEKSFRLLEKRVIQEIDVQNAVIAVGGGAVLDPENCQSLKVLGTLIYLECAKETLRKRLLIPPLPSFLEAGDPEGSFERMHRERLACYEKIQAVRVEANTSPKDVILAFRKERLIDL